MERKKKAAGPRKTSLAVDPTKWRAVRRIAFEHRTTAAALVDKCLDRIIRTEALKAPKKAR